jgi:hypothetical protein
VLSRAIDSASPPGDRRPRHPDEPAWKAADTEEKVRDLAAGPGAIIVCGRFEGVDQRVIESRQLEEISVGDFILSGGEPAAMMLLDAMVRLLPGVMGNEAFGRGGEFRERPAGASALYAAAGLRRPGDSGRSDLRQPRGKIAQVAARSRRRRLTKAPDARTCFAEGNQPVVK